MVSLANHPLVVFGTASFGTGTPQAKFNSPITANPILSTLHRHRITHIDAARAYPVGSPGTCEALLGALSVPSRFTVSTKVTSWMPGAHSSANIAASVSASLTALGTEKVDIMYLHSPDRTTPFEETCRAMDQEYRQGRFERFGLSNFTTEEVERLCTICKKEGWVTPSVYQGRYNPIIRSGEEELFPTLRKWGISFYCYSPSAAGIFSGDINETSVNIAGSRWDSNTRLGVTYKEAYLKPSILSAAKRIATTAKATGIDGHAAALRWTVYHSILSAEYGDAVVLGASSVEQLEENLEAVEAGPLDKELVQAVDSVWGEVRNDAAKYCL